VQARLCRDVQGIEEHEHARINFSLTSKESLSHCDAFGELIHMHILLPNVLLLL